MKATTSEASAIGRTSFVPPRQLGAADAHVGARVALAARRGELLGRVDGGDVLGAQPGHELVREPALAHVERAHSASTPAASESSTASRGT